MKSSAEREVRRVGYNIKFPQIHQNTQGSQPINQVDDYKSPKFSQNKL